MTTIRLRGLAERAGCAEYPLGPDVIVPETVSVYLEFNKRNGPVGTATLRRDEAGIWADAVLDLDSGTKSADLLRHVNGKGRLRKTWPAFAISVAGAVVTKDGVTGGTVADLSLCQANSDPDLPPYEVIYDQAFSISASSPYRSRQATGPAAGT